MARNYTVSERAIIIIGLKANIPPVKIQMLLLEEQKRLGLTERRVPASSFAMVKYKYLPNMTDEQIWEHIQSPKSLGGLK